MSNNIFMYITAISIWCWWKKQGLMKLVNIHLWHLLSTYPARQMKWSVSSSISEIESISVYFHFIILSTFHAESLHIVLYLLLIVPPSLLFLSFVFLCPCRRATVGGRQGCRRNIILLAGLISLHSDITLLRNSFHCFPTRFWTDAAILLLTKLR